MKNLIRSLLLTLLLSAATSVFAGLEGVQVTIKNKGGKTVYQGTTSQNGKFSSGQLAAGSYSLEFRAPKGAGLSAKQLAISFAAGKDAPRNANAVGKHLESGVALALEVTSNAKVTGQVSIAGAALAAENAAAPSGTEKVKANVKVINGKRYVWVPGAIGSNMGGKWVEEGTEGAALRTSNRKGGDAEVLRHVQDQSANVGSRPDGG